MHSLNNKRLTDATNRSVQTIRQSAPVVFLIKERISNSHEALVWSRALLAKTQHMASWYHRSRLRRSGRTKLLFNAVRSPIGPII